MPRASGNIYIQARTQQTELAGGIFSEANATESISSPQVVPLPLAPPLAELNQQFLATHQSASVAALKDVQTVMVFKCGVLSLWKNNGRDMVEIASKEVTPPAYHALKSVCHAPLICIGSLKSENASAETWIELCERLEHSLRSVDTQRVDVHSRENMAAILQHSVICIKQLQNCARWSLHDKEVRGILTQYQRRIDANIKILSAAATELQLSSLHEIIQQWITTQEIDLTKNRVLLVAPHGPRKGFIEMQYFVDLYKRQSKEIDEPIEDNYIYYIEMLGSQMGEVDVKTCLIEEFLAREEQNKTVARWMLGDPLGMQQDVLKECAPGIIDKLLTKAPLSPLRTSAYPST